MQLPNPNSPQAGRSRRATRFGKSAHDRPQLSAVEQNGAKESTAIDAHISSLKVLALSLLTRIESLERQKAADESLDFNLQVEVRRFEAELIRNALIQTGGRQRRAARLLGTKVTTLNTKIRRYQISLDETIDMNS